MKNSNVNNRRITLLAMFTSTGTLLCCALPITLVTLGLGSTVAALTSNLPFLVALSTHKAWVFAFSGSLLLLGGWLLFRSSQSCPADEDQAMLCQQMNKWNHRIYWSSIVIWCTGFFAAYLALPIRIWLDS